MADSDVEVDEATDAVAALALTSYRGRVVTKQKKSAFVRPQYGGNNLYAHENSFLSNFADVRVDDTVEYVLGEHRGTPQAVAVKVLNLLGWAYGGKLDYATDCEQAAHAFRRAGVAAIHELRRQYVEFMPEDDSAEARTLFYKSAAEGKGAYLWTEGKGADIPSAVLGVRFLLERLCYLDKKGDLEKYLLGGSISRQSDLANRVSSLLRGANKGLDGPVQWSGHGQLKPHPYTEVTELSIIEIVDKLGVILEVLFEGRIPNGVNVNPRAVAPALLQAFNAPSITAAKLKEGENKDGTPSKKQAHNYPLEVFEAKLKAA